MGYVSQAQLDWARPLNADLIDANELGLVLDQMAGGLSADESADMVRSSATCRRVAGFIKPSGSALRDDSATDSSTDAVARAHAAE